MTDRFKKYFTELKALTNRELDRSAEKLVDVENASIAKLIAHLAEMAERKTALELGYPSLFEYCMRRLNLSKGAIPARLQVANVCRCFPELLVALSERRISLTVAGLLAPHVNQDNVNELIDACSGKTCDDTKLYLVGIAPKEVFQPSIRKVPRTAQDAPTASPPKVEETPPVTTKELPACPTKSSPAKVEPARREEFNFKFGASKEFKDKFERLAAVMGVLNAEGRIVEIIEKALDAALDQHDPQRRHERRVQREQNKTAKSRLNEIEPKAKPEPSANVKRRMPIAKYDRIHAAGDYQCEYCAPDGTRCTARVVQVDHVLPFGLVPHHDERLMRLLCPMHNLFEAERVYGKAFVQKKIRARRARSRVDT